MGGKHYWPVGEEIASDSVGTSEWIEAAIIIAVAVFAAIAINYASQRAVGRADTERFAARFVGRLLAFVAVAAGLIYALSALEVRIGPLLGALGIGGLALAFALQDIIENFAAGLILQIRRPMRNGDQIFTTGYEGIVMEINLRSTILRTFDGETVYIPNANALKNPLINYTRRGSRRTNLTVGIDYRADLATAKSVILGAVKDVDGVLGQPPPEAYVYEFGDSSVNIMIQYWHRPQIAELWQTRDAVVLAVKSALDEAGIGIPFPQRTLHFSDGIDVTTTAKPS